MQMFTNANALARAARVFLPLVMLLTSVAAVAVGQSTDIAAPSPVRSDEVVGTIAARDLGDPRVTDHFYAFTGTPGDVLITVDSRNLNGDVDVFTFSGLQPLLKFTVYAGSSAAITKNIYLRKQEDLILRVEGRTPNDDDAVYRIHFSGTFAPLASAPWLSESDNVTQPATAANGTAKKGRRVSSVGAHINEPPAEVAEAPTPEPTPAEPVEAAPKTAAVKPKPGNSRVRRPATRPVTKKTRPAETTTPEESAAAKDETETTAPAENPDSEPKKPTPARKRPTRRSTTARTAKPAPAPAPTQEPEESGPRLLIETSDGTLVDRYMSSVRRVTVENGQVVVIGKDGKIQRIPLASVVRMTISP
jgi:hypothetical protein